MEKLSYSENNSIDDSSMSLSDDYNDVYIEHKIYKKNIQFNLSSKKNLQRKIF